jgi:DeoR/GlpR family transcriptional regulator of sugar metabolism
MINPALSRRENELLQLLRADLSVTVSVLGEKLQVSTTTIRSLLNALAAQNMIVKSRGRIVPAFHPSIIAKQGCRVEEKLRIAEAAAKMVKDDDIVMIGGGTTTTLVARFFFGKSDVRVITPCALILPYARTNPRLHLTLLGGEFRPSNESFVGPRTLEELERYHARIAFIGTDGLTVEHGPSYGLVEDAATQLKITESSDKTVLMADSSKCGHKGFVNTFPWSRISALISDTGLPSEFAQALKDQNIDVILV